MKRNDKIELLRQWVDSAGSGLEIGPHIDPMFRKSAGEAVKYVETRTTEELRAFMEKEGRDPDLVEEIDYLFHQGQPLAETVRGESFDWVASSHVLEHIPDFVGHLNEVRDVLKDGGVYAVIVPDRYLCFDCLKPPSSLGEVLQAHMEKRQVPTIASNIDELRYGARPKGIKVGGWRMPEASRGLSLKYPGWRERVRNILNSDGGETRPEIRMGHSWRFDPVSFAQILADLSSLELIGLQLVHLQATYNTDFVAVLKRVPQIDTEDVVRIGQAVDEEYDPPQYPNVPF